MDGLTLIAQARAAGLEVRVDGEHLVIRGPRSAETLALTLRAHKPEIMVILSHVVEAECADTQRPVQWSFHCPFDPFGEGWHEYAMQRTADGRSICIHCGHIRGTETIPYNTDAPAVSPTQFVIEMKRRRNDIRRWARAHDWSRVTYAPALSTGGDETAWEKFLRDAGAADVTKAWRWVVSQTCEEVTA